MDSHVNEFFSSSRNDAPKGHFHRVIALQNTPDIDWGTIHQMVPLLPKAWFELSRLPPEERLEFTRDYWISKFTPFPRFIVFLTRFFPHIDDIGIFITQQKFDDPLVVQMVYSLANNKGFFRGLPPVSEDSLAALKKQFPQAIFPEDYCAFLAIHNGFSKSTDTGVLSTSEIHTTYEMVVNLLADGEPLTTPTGQAIDPSTLIPFYESFGMPFFQCFWVDWYPEQEMGNVYCSAPAKQISDPKATSPSESMAFPTFSDWLKFYLEAFT